MRHVLLLRGINLGPHRRIAMPDLRAALHEAGYQDVRTHLQSGNIVLDAEDDPAALAERVTGLIERRYGLDVPVITRSATELAAVVALDPLRAVVTDPKRYQVSFCAQPPGAEVLEHLRAAAAADERVELHGREIYAWHPDGVARSKLWNAVAGTGLGTTATTRNWATVAALHGLVAEAVVS